MGTTSEARRIESQGEGVKSGKVKRSKDYRRRSKAGNKGLGASSEIKSQKLEGKGHRFSASDLRPLSSDIFRAFQSFVGSLW